MPANKLKDAFPAPPSQEKVNKFVMAAKDGKFKTVNALLAKYPGIIDLKATDIDGVFWSDTALYGAAYWGPKEMVELLLSKGASTEIKDPIGHTPLLGAARLGRTDIVVLLLKNGAAINAKSNYNETPLIAATIDGHMDTIQLLLENGASIHDRNGGGLTAVDVARKNGYSEAVDLIEQWPTLTQQQKDELKKLAHPEIPAGRLEKLKSQRPKQSPFKKNQP